MTDQEMISQVHKAKMLGLNVVEIEITHTSKVYIISKSKTEHILLVPSNVYWLNGESGLTTTEHLTELRGEIKLIGGENLTDISRLFLCQRFNKIDLSKLNTSKVKTMEKTFNYCTTVVLDLSTLDTKSVNNMSKMFEKFKGDRIIFGDIDTSNVKYMRRMFSDCELRCNELNLSNFNTLNVVDMYAMFMNCKVKNIDVRNFNTSKVQIMREMFSECAAERLNITSFTDKSLKSSALMFEGCQAKIILSKDNGERIINEAQHRGVNWGA